MRLWAFLGKRISYISFKLVSNISRRVCVQNCIYFLCCYSRSGQYWCQIFPTLTPPTLITFPLTQRPLSSLSYTLQIRSFGSGVRFQERLKNIWMDWLFLPVLSYYYYYYLWFIWIRTKLRHPHTICLLCKLFLNLKPV